MLRKLMVMILIVVSTVTALSAVSGLRAYGELQSTLDFYHSRLFTGNDTGEFEWGWNNFANFRLRADIGEYMEFGCDINATVMAGKYAALFPLDGIEGMFSGVPVDASSDPAIQYIFGQAGSIFSIDFYLRNMNIASLGIDRLYFSGGNRYFDITAGLIRFARGYGYIFSPSDFFNTKNPLNPEARLAGKLGAVATFYPKDLWKIETFAIGPDNPLDTKGWGWKFGAATNFSTGKFNFEFLYTFLMPEMKYGKDQAAAGYPDFINNDFSHIFGYSMKLDVEVGLFVDMTYRLDHRVVREGTYYGNPFHGYQGLNFAVGVDYTIGGKVYILCEYMFYGAGMVDWQERSLDSMYVLPDGSGGWDIDKDWDTRKIYERTTNPEKRPQSFLRHDYIFGMVRGEVNDYLSLGASYLFGADDQSGLLNVFFNIAPTQGFTIDVSAMFPFDWHMVNSSWEAGEFSSTQLGFRQLYRIAVTMKF